MEAKRGAPEAASLRQLVVTVWATDAVLQSSWEQARARTLAVVVEAARAGQTAIAHILNLSLLPASLNVRVPQLRRHDQVVFTRLHLLGRILTLQ